MYKKITVLLLSVLALLMLSCSILSYSAYAESRLAVEFVDMPKSVYVGETYLMGDIKVKYPEEVDSLDYVVVAPNGSVVKLQDAGFFVDQEGTYKLLVSVSSIDGISVAHDSFYISAIVNPAPMMIEQPYVQKKFVLNTSYVVSPAKFIDYNTSTPTEVEYDVFYNGVEKQPGEMLKFTQAGDLEIKYVAKSSVTNQENVLTYNVPIVDAFTIDNTTSKRKYDFTKLFAKSENVKSIEQVNEGVSFKADSDFEVEFINAVSDSTTIVSLLTTSTGYNFDSVKITFSDVRKPMNQFSVTLKDEVGYLAVISDDGTVYKINNVNFNKPKTTGEGYNEVSIEYNADDMAILDSGKKKVCSIETTSFGTTFEKFSDGLVNIKIQVQGVKPTSELIVCKLKNQSFQSAANIDRQSPFYTDNLIKNISYQNDIVLPVLNVYDVLEPNLVGTVSLYYNGKPVTDNEGRLVKDLPTNQTYYIRAENIGQYRVMYNCVDSSNNKYAITINLNVEDNVKPTLTCTPIPSYVKLNSSLKLPSCTYSDNVSKKEDMTLLISIFEQNGNTKNFKPGDTYKFIEKGMYLIAYTVYDENGNFDYEYFKVYCD